MTWHLRLLDKAAYQTMVEALDAFARGDPQLLTSLVARSHAYLRSEAFARRHRICPGFADAFAERLDKAVAERDMRELAESLIAYTAMPDYQLGLSYNSEDSPNLVDFGNDPLYPALQRVAPWMYRLIHDRLKTDRPRYEVGSSMILLRREDLERLCGALRQVHDPDLAELRDRVLDLFERSLADESTAVAMSDAEGIYMDKEGKFPLNIPPRDEAEPPPPDINVDITGPPDRPDIARMLQDIREHRPGGCDKPVIDGGIGGCESLGTADTYPFLAPAATSNISFVLLPFDHFPPGAAVDIELIQCGATPASIVTRTQAIPRAMPPEEVSFSVPTEPHQKYFFRVSHKVPGMRVLAMYVVKPGPP